MMSSADTIVKMISDRSSHTGGTIHLSESLENVGLDSMEVVSLIFDIEEAFNIQIPLNANMDIEGKTVADLIQSVDKLVAAKVASNGTGLSLPGSALSRLLDNRQRTIGILWLRADRPSRCQPSE